MKHERRKIALAQMANAGSVEANLQKSLALLREAAENGRTVHAHRTENPRRGERGRPP
nr:hypothetical protein [uncultured Agathobaculum sp.]